MTEAVVFDRVAKRYEAHVAVASLSLAIPSGTIYGILGPNGAGKTTSIRMLMNIIAPDEGQITVLGRNSTESGVTDRIGYLPEERGLYRRMPVRAVLRFLAELKGVPRREADRRIDEWLERLALRTPERDWGDAKVEELSRGMQQKVQFIGTLVHDPDLVILDEPFSGLDPINAQALKDAMLELRQRGKTVIFSTHMMDNAERMCDSVCIIAGGRKVLDGTVRELRAGAGLARQVAIAFDPTAGDTGDRAAAATVFGDRTMVTRIEDFGQTVDVELASDADPQQLLRSLVSAGVAIRRFELVQPSLHQIFLETVGASGVERGMSGHG